MLSACGGHVWPPFCGWLLALLMVALAIPVEPNLNTSSSVLKLIAASPIHNYGGINTSYLFHPDLKPLPTFPCGNHYTHHLRGVGFCSNLRAVLSDFLHSIMTKRAFSVTEVAWAYGCTIKGKKRSLSCYFRPPYPCGMSTNQESTPPWKNGRLWNLSPTQITNMLTLMNAMDLPHTHLYMARELLLYLWRYNNEAAHKLASYVRKQNLTSPYISVHIRRGDKNRARKPIPLKKIVQRVKDHLSKQKLNVTQVFVMADDVHVISDIQTIAGDEWQVVSNTRKAQTGFNACTMPTRREGSHCKHRKKLDLKDNMNIKPVDGTVEAYTLLTALEVSRHAAFFYGDCESNVGHTVQLLRYQRPETALCYDTGKPIKGYSMDI